MPLSGASWAVTLIVRVHALDERKQQRGNVYLRILPSVLLVALAFASSGCGGGASGDSGDSNPPPPGAYTVIHKFNGGADGVFLNAGLMRNADLNLYDVRDVGRQSN
jgi:hypothetical protein